jgi:hypothetical protein
MANINVPNSSTFEQWRVKTNDISDAVGDVDNLTVTNTGGTDVVTSLADIKDDTDTNTSSIGTMSGLYGSYVDLVTALGNLDSRTTTNTTNITSNDVDIAANLTSIGTIGNLYSGVADLVLASNDLNVRINSNDTDIATNVTNITSNDTDIATNVTNIITNATAIGTVGSLYGSHSNLVSAVQGIESFPLTNANWDGTDGLTLLGALNNHEGRLDTSESDITAIEVDIGSWDHTSRGTISTVITTIEGIQSNLTSNFVNVSGDTMTGALIAGGGVYAASGNYLNLGVDSVDTIRINSSNRIGVGKAAHTSYKVDVSGSLNATSLREGGSLLSTLYQSISSSGGTSTIAADTVFTGSVEFTDEVSLSSDYGAGRKVYLGHDEDNSNAPLLVYDKDGGLSFKEFLQDVTGSMFTSNTESGGISAVYSDGSGTITLAIADDGHNHTISNVDGLQTALNNKVDDTQVLTNVPSGAVFTDTETTTSISIASNNITYTDEVGNDTVLDLSLYLDDTNLARLTSGSLNGTSGIATFTRDDGTTFTLDLSPLLDDTVVTYSTSIPTSTTKLRLSGSNSTTDDIEFVGSGATTITRTDDSKFTISSTDTNINTNQLTTFTVRDGDSTSVTLGHGKTWQFIESNEIDVNWSDTSGTTVGLTFDHKDTTRTNNTTTSSPAHGATFTAIDSITSNDRGHITAVNTKTITLPADNDTTYSVGDDGLTQKNFTTTLYNLLNGATSAETASTLVKRNSTGGADLDHIYIGADGSSDAELFFYDDNSNTNRTLRWDDSSSEFQVEDNGGTMRTLYHSGNHTDTTYTTATSGTLGLVKIGYAESGKNYPVELSSDKMYVNVPWVDTVYNHPTSAGNKHIPSGGSSNNYLKYSSAGTVSWQTTTTLKILNSAGTTLKTIRGGNA